MPRIIEFLSEHEEIDKFISLISVAELVCALKYDKEFRRFSVKTSYIQKLLEELQSTMDLKIILTEKVKRTRIEGVIISSNIVKYLNKHNHLVDCIHLDIAKSHELCFLTDEKKMGNLKTFYKNIMTENKFMKQFN